MGNQQAIPEEIADRFATCELESIERKFQKLADEGSFRKKSFDKKTFQKYYFTSYPSISELLFNAFDTQGNGKVDFEQFIKGLVLIRGSFDEKISFMFKMFRLKKGKSISIDEFRVVTSSGIFAGKKEKREEKKQRVKDLAAEVFGAYDQDRDKSLNRKEFTNWAKQSLESTILLDLFKKLDNLLTASGSISGPTNVMHETHVAKTDDGGFSIDNIPPSWLELFVQAGITKKELEDPSTAMMLMGIVADKITNKINAQPQAAPVVHHHQQQQQQPTSTSNPAVVDQAPTPTSNPTAAVPAAPAPPPLQTRPVQPSTPNNQKKPVLSKDTSSLLADIRKGRDLKRVEADTGLGELSHDDKNDLTNILMRAIHDHRTNLKIEENSDDEDDWDD